MTRQAKIVLLLICTALILACSGTSVRQPRIGATTNLQWPEAPQAARIKYLYSVSQPADLGIKRGFWGRTWRFIKGVKQSDTLVKPMGVHVDFEGRLYVVDTHRQKVHVFNSEESSYYTFPEEEQDVLQFPVDITTDKAGRVYITDSAAKLVHVFSEHGKKYLRSVGAGHFERPTGITTRYGGSELLVVDTLASRILVLDSTSLAIKQAVGSDGYGSKELHFPTSIAVAYDGFIYVTDALNFRVQVLNEQFEFVDQFGQAGDGPGSFSRPKGVAIDSDGHVYVVDALFDNVQVFNQQGELLMAIGSSGQAPGEFWLPNEIFIDANDRIYVSDAYNARVQVFQYLGTGEQP